MVTCVFWFPCVMSPCLQISHVWTLDTSIGGTVLGDLFLRSLVQPEDTEAQKWGLRVTGSLHFRPELPLLNSQTVSRQLPCSLHSSSPAMIDYSPSKHEPKNLLPSVHVSIGKGTTQRQRQTGAWPHFPWSNDSNFTRSSFTWTSEDNLQPTVSKHTITVFIGVSVLGKMGDTDTVFLSPYNILWYMMAPKASWVQYRNEGHPRHHGYSMKWRTPKASWVQ